MPGLKKSPGMADIDVCFGAHKAGADGVQSALRKARWRYEERTLQRGEKLDANRLSDFVSSPEDEADVADGERARYSNGPVSPLAPDGFEDVPSPLQSGVLEESGDMNGENGGGSSQEEQSDLEEQVDDIPVPSPLLEEGFMNGDSLPESAAVEKAMDVQEEPTGKLSPSSPLLRETADDTLSSPLQPIPIELFDPDESRLPPTPPTLDNSDESERTRNENADEPPRLVEDVRNALPSKRSGQNMTPVNQPASPPTPDPSPPRQRNESPTIPPAMEQLQKPPALMPGSFVASDAAVEESAGSIEDSFKTAEVDQNVVSHEDTSEVRLRDSDTLPAHWLDSMRELKSADLGLGNITVQQTPEINTTATPPAKTRNFSGIDQQSSTIMPKQHEENGQSAKQSAEDRNNIIYRRLQEENIARHSAVSANSGAITVGITIPSNESTPRTLKRRGKRSSLRMETSDDEKRDGTTITDGVRTITAGDSNRVHGLGIQSSENVANAADPNAINRDGGAATTSGRTLKQRKARELDKTSILTESPLFGRSTLDDSPVFASNIRQVSSPARIGPDPSDMTALTYASLQDSPSALRASRFQQNPPQKLRHVSYEDRLSRNMSVRRTSLEASPPMQELPFRPKPAKPVMNNIAVKRSQAEATSPTESPEMRSPGGTLRRFSREERLENNSSVRRTSLEPAPQSPPMAETAPPRKSIDRATVSSPRRSMDARYLFPTTTPGSFSQFSDRTGDIEIGEANGIRLFPHNNESLLVVEQGSRPPSNDRDASEAPNFYDEESRSTRPIFTARIGPPVFTARIEPPTPTLSMTKPTPNVHSPLTNPRIAPEPPSFKFIPPTPERELNAQLGNRQPLKVNTAPEPSSPRKRLSMLQRARKSVDIMFPTIGSLRRANPRDSEARDTHLSPLWRPQGFWDEFDSEDEYDDFEPPGSLPRGGDTSNVGEAEAQKRGLFPRAMSRRLPGFRGNGGFLQGNSLGIDRHGTNNRRHYVSTGTRTLSKQQSAEVIRNLSVNAGAGVSAEHRMLKTRSVAHWLGARKFRARMKALRLKREEKEREKRREKIRKSIGFRLYHNGQGG